MVVEPTKDVGTVGPGLGNILMRERERDNWMHSFYKNLLHNARILIQHVNEAQQ